MLTDIAISREYRVASIVSKRLDPGWIVSPWRV
jgi:hypothetical protein